MDTTLSQEARAKIALELVDKSIIHPDAINSAYAWYLRGLIYKEWYKTFEKHNKKSKTRLDAVVFLKKALALDTSKGQPIHIKNNIEFNGNVYIITDVYNVANIKLALKYIATLFYNDAGSSLDATNYSSAIENYEKAKECFLIAEPNYNVKIREVEFKLALATVYEKVFRSDIKANSQFFGMTEDLYKQVIVLDTNNWAGNYNFAMLYYNYGVDLINDMDVTSDIVSVDKITEQTRELFKKALPYALKAYALNPKRRDVIVCLQGIYYSLYEFEKSDEFKAKVELIDKEK